MKLDWNKKYTTIAVYAFLTGAALIFLWAFIYYRYEVQNVIKMALSFLSPVIYGVVIAYILLPLDRLIYRLIGKIFSKGKKKHPKFQKYASLTLTYVIFLGILTGFVFLVLPDIKHSVTEFSSNISKYSSRVINYISSLHLPFLEDVDLTKTVNDLLNTAKTAAPTAYSYIYGAVSGVLGGALDAVIGLLISAYILSGRRRFKKRSKKFLYAVFKEKTVANILAFFYEVNRIFSGFIGGKILDSAIIGVLAFIGLSILRMPNPGLLSLIIGVTNVIPFFGPFIGAIPSAIIVLAVEPEKTIWFIIFIIALQQLDGNVIGPRILGDSTGLPAFWVIFSILLLGGFFGIGGMIMAVPVFALIFMSMKKFSERRLAKKGLPVETAAYASPGLLKLPESEKTQSEESKEQEKAGEKEEK